MSQLNLIRIFFALVGWLFIVFSLQSKASVLVCQQTFADLHKSSGVFAINEVSREKSAKDLLDLYFEPHPQYVEGPLSNLSQLLAKAHVDSKNVSAGEQALAKIEASYSSTEVIKTALALLNGTHPYSSRIQVIVTYGNSTPVAQLGRIEAHTYWLPPFGIHQNTQQGLIEVHKPIDATEKIYVLLNFGRRSSYIKNPQAWVEVLMHELTHVADGILLEHWVQANLALINKGLQPDNLFAEFVRYDPSSRSVSLSRTFREFFSESRATASQIMASAHLPVQLNPRATAYSMMENLLRADPFDMMGLFIRKDINVENFLPWGARLGHLMLDTILDHKPLPSGPNRGLLH